MDIKDLNKSQLILLAILLSFITSIATGITTVTLIEQAPSSVTVPINRVVRQTVEKIVPQEGKTITNTIVIKEEDLVVDAIAENQPSVFSVTKETQDADGNTIEMGAGNGFIVSNDGIIVVDGALVSDSSGIYYLKNKSGKFYADFISINKNGFALLKIGKPLDEKNKEAVITLPVFGDLSKIKVGQKILVLGNTISSFIFDGDNININVTKSNGGAEVFDLDGQVLGIALSGDNSFVDINLISDALKTKETSTPAVSPAPLLSPTF